MYFISFVDVDIFGDDFTALIDGFNDDFIGVFIAFTAFITFIALISPSARSLHFILASSGSSDGYAIE